MHPLLAVQAFAGPIVFHLVLRSCAETLLGFDMAVEDAVAQLAQTWVAGMRPDKEEWMERRYAIALAVGCPSTSTIVECAEVRS